MNTISRRERVKLSKKEQKVAEAITLPVTLLLLIIFYLFRLLIKALYRSKLWIGRFCLVLFIFSSAYNALQGTVYAPKSAHAMDKSSVVVKSVNHAPTQRELIDAYIIQVFGTHATDFNAVLDCENHARNPYAVGTNTDGSRDIGIAQINNHWQGVTNEAFLTDYKINILMAYSIYSRDGYSFKLWTCGRKLGL